MCSSSGSGGGGARGGRGSSSCEVSGLARISRANIKQIESDGLMLSMFESSIKDELPGQLLRTNAFLRRPARSCPRATEKIH